MADPTNPWQVTTQGNAGRVATLAIAIPITLAGKDANGVEFTEKTRTIVVDQFGGKIATKSVLTLGCELNLHNLIVGKAVRVKVTWLGERRTADEPYEIGIQLLGSHNIWGIDFPSYDRQEGAPGAARPKVRGPRMPAEAPSAEQLGASGSFVPDASSPVRPLEIGRPSPSFAQPAMQASRPSPLPVAVETPPAVEESKELIKATLTRFTQPLEAPAENKAQLLIERKLEELSRPIGQLMQSKIQEVTQRFEAHESILDAHVKNLQGDVLACRGEMQQLVAELGDLKQKVQGEMEKTLAEVQESRPKIIELTMGDLTTKVRAEVDSVTDELVNLTERRVQEQVAAALEPLIQGTLERVYSVAEEQSAKVEQGFQGQLGHLLEEGQAEVGRMLQSANSEIGEKIHHASAAAIASAQGDVAKAFEAQLQKTTDELSEAAARQLQNQVEDALLLSGEELKACAKNATAEIEERLSSARRSALEAVSNAAAHSLEEFQSRLGERAEGCADNYIKRVEETLAKAEGEQQKSALSGFREALEQERAGVLASMNDDLAQILQAVSEQAGRQAGALNDLRKAVEEESLQTLANLKGAATQTFEEISAEVERQTNALQDLREAVQEESAKTLVKAKSDASQAIRGLSEQVGRDMEALNTLRKSLMEESAQALPQFREDLGRMLSEVTEQVQQQLNMLCSLLNLIEKESGQISTKVKNDVAEVLAENSRLAEEQMKGIQSSLNDWETQMGSRVEAQLRQLEVKTRTSLETLQQQSAELLNRTLEKLRSESGALPGQLEATLKNAADHIERDSVERIQSNQQQMADAIINASAAQLGRQLRENLELFGEQLRRQEDQVASTLAEALRSKMMEMLSVIQTPSRSSPPPAQPPSQDSSEPLCLKARA